MRLSYTVTVDFTERDECTTLMAVRIGSESGDIGTCDDDRVRGRDLALWLGAAIISDARENWGNDCVQAAADIADAEAQRYQDEGERASGADKGGRYF